MEGIIVTQLLLLFCCSTWSSMRKKIDFRVHLKDNEKKQTCCTNNLVEQQNDKNDLK